MAEGSEREAGAMSCLLTEEARLQKRINSRINRELQRDYKESKREIKLLLLGESCLLSPANEQLERVRGLNGSVVRVESVGITVARPVYRDRSGKSNTCSMPCASTMVGLYL